MAKFEDAINQTITSCKQAGNELKYHFAGAGKQIDIDKGAVFKKVNY